MLHSSSTITHCDCVLRPWKPSDVSVGCWLIAKLDLHSLMRASPPTCTAFHHLNDGAAAWNRVTAERSLCESQTCSPVLRMLTWPCDFLMPLRLAAERLRSCAMSCRPAPPLMEFMPASRLAILVQPPPTGWNGWCLVCLQKRSKRSSGRCPSACESASSHCGKLLRRLQNPSHLLKVQYLSPLQRTLPKWLVWRSRLVTLTARNYRRICACISKWYRMRVTSWLLVMTSPRCEDRWLPRLQRIEKVS